MLGQRQPGLGTDALGRWPARSCAGHVAVEFGQRYREVMPEQAGRDISLIGVLRGLSRTAPNDGKGAPTGALLHSDGDTATAPINRSQADLPGKVLR